MRPVPFLASFTLKFFRMASAAKDNRALLVLSTVGWFFPLHRWGTLPVLMR